MHEVVRMGPYRVLEADDGCNYHVIWTAQTRTAISACLGMARRSYDL